MDLPVAVPAWSAPMPNALTALYVARNGTQEVDNISLSPEQRIRNYQAWASKAVTHLTASFDTEDIERLVLTPRHWALVHAAASGSGHLLIETVNLEMNERRQVFDNLVTAYMTAANLLSRNTVCLVPDTNFFIHASKSFDKVDYEDLASRAGISSGSRLHLVVPYRVLRELDGLKAAGYKSFVGDTKELVRTRAAWTVKRLQQLFNAKFDSPTLIPGTQVGVEVIRDHRTHRPSPDGDTEIVDRAVAVKKLTGRPLYLVTSDVGMEMLAGTRGLEAMRFSRATQASTETSDDD